MAGRVCGSHGGQQVTLAGRVCRGQRGVQAGHGGRGRGEAGRAGRLLAQELVAGPGHCQRRHQGGRVEVGSQERRVEHASCGGGSCLLLGGECGQLQLVMESREPRQAPAAPAPQVVVVVVASPEVAGGPQVGPQADTQVRGGRLVGEAAAARVLVRVAALLHHCARVSAGAHASHQPCNNTIILCNINTQK